MNNTLKFCYKGDRNYVQGPDIVNSVLEDMLDLDMSNLDIKMNGIVKNCLEIVKGRDISGAKVNLSWIKNNEIQEYQLVENSETIECRYEYDEEKIINKTTLDLANQSILLKNITSYTICENFVAMNKFLLQSLYPDVKGKWYFTRLEQSMIISDDLLIEVKLIKNSNFRLVKSDILYNGKTIASVYFTLVRG